MFLPSGSLCPVNHPCGPGPALAAAQSIPMDVQAQGTSEHNTMTAPLGRRNTLGIALFVILTVLGIILYVSFAKWPKKILRGWAQHIRSRIGRKKTGDREAGADEHKTPNTGGARVDHQGYTPSALLAVTSPELSPAMSDPGNEKKKKKHRVSTSMCSVDLSS